MTLFDYEYMAEEEKEQWLDSFQILSGLRYFGGKSTIAKNLANHILNMAVKIHQDGYGKTTFIDAFTGGGKVALSMPAGWFDKIVMNDLNYGVYNYFKYCKEEPEALVKMIEMLGSVMSEPFFKFCAWCRSNDGNTNRKSEADSLLKQAEAIKEKTEHTDEEKELLKKAEGIRKAYDFLDDTRVEPLASAAMTYWVTQSSFNGTTDPERVSYRLGLKDNQTGSPTRGQEKEEIAKIIRHAKKHIPLIHDRMEKLNIIVENMDYGDLIRKYNGKPFSDSLQEEKAFEENKEYQILWYFDPPYHPATLNEGNSAPYEDSFDLENVERMTHILHGDYEQEYGKLEYFIKSDYDPKYTYKQFKKQLEESEYKLAYETKKTGNSDKIEKYKNVIKRLEKQAEESENHLKDFDVLEDNIKWEGHKANTTDPIFYKECLGEFYKGVNVTEEGERAKGREYIWCRGNYIPEN